MNKIGPIMDGKELDYAGDESVKITNPATGEIIAEQVCCNLEFVNKISEASNKAFYSEQWQNVMPSERGKLLYKLADLLETNSEEFIELEMQDTGKPISQLRGEIPLAAEIIRFYAGAADKIEGKVKSVSGGTFQFTMYEPYGVVAGILPWNYPLVNVAMKVAPAVAAGNTIIVKPSVETPLTTVAFAKLCIKACFPENIVNVVLGKGSKSGNYLVENPLVKKISFTGSTSIGQRIQKQAVEQMKSVNLELGGKNAIIVFEDAHLEKAADAAIISAFVNAGQLCVSCSRLLVQKSIASKFEEIIKTKMKNVKIGNPKDEATQIGPMITKLQYDTATDYIKIAKEEGCQILYGEETKIIDNSLANGFWLTPTIVTNAKQDMRVATEEIFGPVLSMITFDDESDAVNISNNVEYGLSGSVWTNDSYRALRMIKSLNTGIIWVNNMLEGYPQISVPPHKMSGTGVELGIEGLMTYCKQKSAVISYNDSVPVGWNL